MTYARLIIPTNDSKQKRLLLEFISHFYIFKSIFRNF